ncbi:MAG: amidase, partial [Candidatus Methylacidiphilales bacterium]
MDHWLTCSATTQARAIREGQISCRELVSAHLACIEEVNPSINAVVFRTVERAMAEAVTADAVLERWKSNDPGPVLGPLHGVPMTIKDNLDTQGVISTGGIHGRAGFVPARDATVVARLRAAGAILLGKTNTPELTMAYETANLLHGATCNPYNTALTPGGSSGGAAAIIATGGSPLDIGSDTGGSIRVPAHFCGIAGLKPTAGL